jgi:hypothetical protein
VHRTGNSTWWKQRSCIPTIKCGDVTGDVGCINSVCCWFLQKQEATCPWPDCSPALWPEKSRTSSNAPVMLTFAALFGCADPDVRVDMETFLNTVVPEVRPDRPSGRNLSCHQCSDSTQPMGQRDAAGRQQQSHSAPAVCNALCVCHAAHPAAVGHAPGVPPQSNGSWAQTLPHKYLKTLPVGAGVCYLSCWCCGAAVGQGSSLDPHR